MGFTAKEHKKGLVFVISAPSGCGKTTLCNRLLKGDLGLLRSVSVTTRPPRKRERQGKDYIFVSKEEFKRRLKKREFLEHAEVFDNFYATPKGPTIAALNKGKDVLLSIDVKGAMQVKRALPGKNVFIFILPPSFSVLKKRLINRCADSKEQIKKRLSLAKFELSFVSKYDYAVVNRKLEDSLSKLKVIIVAERLKIRERALKQRGLA